jgi:aspartokinase-like uncharacterized kinase
MSNTRKFIATAAFASLALAKGALPVRAGEVNALTVTPAKAISLAVGSKRAIGYYLADAGDCKVTVIMSEAFAEQLPANLASVRFNANVAAGTTAWVDTSDGASLMLTCAQGAKFLKVNTIDRVAYQAARK